MTMSSGRQSASQPRTKGERKIQRRQRAFADDHRMHEFDGHVLRIGGVRTASERQQPAAAQKSLRHFAASFRQPARLARKKLFEHLVARQQPLFDVRREFAEW